MEQRTTHRTERRQCAGQNARGGQCRAWVPEYRHSPFCRSHEYVGPAPCVGGGPLDGSWIDRGTVGYNFQFDEITVGEAPDGSTLFLAMPAGNYGPNPRLRGRYRFGYRETDMAPRWSGRRLVS